MWRPSHSCPNCISWHSIGHLFLHLSGHGLFFCSMFICFIWCGHCRSPLGKSPVQLFLTGLVHCNPFAPVQHVWASNGLVSLPWMGWSAAVGCLWSLLVASVVCSCFHRCRSCWSADALSSCHVCVLRRPGQEICCTALLCI